MHRPRRLRSSAGVRNLVHETRLNAHDFILPLFVSEKLKEPRAISSMPGVFQLSVDDAAQEAKQASELGLAMAIVALGQVSMGHGAQPAIFAGLTVSPGGTVRANVPLSAQEKSYVSEGGNTVPPSAVAVLAVPPGFDAQKLSPVATRSFTHPDLLLVWRGDALGCTNL